MLLSWGRSWEGVKGAQGYRLEVFDANRPKVPLKVVVVSQTTTEVELPRLEKYLWRVASLDEDGETDQFSRIQEVSADRASPIPRAIATIENGKKKVLSAPYPHFPIGPSGYLPA